MSKKFLKSVLFFLLLTVAGNSIAAALVKKFKVVYKEEEIGFLEVSKTVGNGVIDFTYQLDITSSVLFRTVRVQYDMDAKYKKGVLDNYHLIYKIDSKVNDEVKTEWQTDHYKITSVKKKDKDRFDSKINYTTVLLFFGEPGPKRTRVWGELNCRYQPLTKQADGGYAMATGGGRSNVFYYKDGKLVRATFDTIIMDFEIRS